MYNHSASHTASKEVSRDLHQVLGALAELIERHPEALRDPDQLAQIHLAGATNSRLRVWIQWSEQYEEGSDV